MVQNLVGALHEFVVYFLHLQIVKTQSHVCETSLSCLQITWVYGPLHISPPQPRLEIFSPLAPAEAIRKWSAFHSRHWTVGPPSLWPHLWSLPLSLCSSPDFQAAFLGLWAWHVTLALPVLLSPLSAAGLSLLSAHFGRPGPVWLPPGPWAECGRPAGPGQHWVCIAHLLRLLASWLVPKGNIPIYLPISGAQNGTWHMRELICACWMNK